MFVVAAFFAALSFGPADPFEAGAAGVTSTGPGPNPLLQNHILVLFHPPILYLGYVGFTVPFAFAIAALVTGRVGEGWLMETRRWALFAWGFLTIGILLGGWWSYEVLGWGGRVGVGPGRERHRSCRGSPAPRTSTRCSCRSGAGCCASGTSACSCATFSLTILGTFLTRSGVLDSVHAFSDGPIGPWLLAFFGARRRRCRSALIAWRGDRLRSPGAIDSPISREGAFLANNVLFTVFAFVVLLGTVFPLIVEALQDRRTVVGAPYFDRLSMPIGLALLFLMAVAPVLPWRKASGELLRDRLFWPAWCGAGALVLAVRRRRRRAGRRCVAFGLGGFAAGSALRQLVLATRRQGWRRPRRPGQRRDGRAPRRDHHRRRARGLEQLHPLGELALEPAGEAVEWGGHTFELASVDAAHERRPEQARAGGRRAPRRRQGLSRRRPRRYLNMGSRRSARRRCAPGSRTTST